MKRGDLVTVAAPGDYGKPRPAVIVQTNAARGQCFRRYLPNDLRDCRGPGFPHHSRTYQKNGLRACSQIMADKPVTIRRERVGHRIGSLDERDVSRLNVALAFVMGLAD